MRMFYVFSELIPGMEFLLTFRYTQQTLLFSLCTTETNTPKLSKNTLLSTFVFQIQNYWLQVFRDNDRSGQGLIGHAAGRIFF